MTMARFVGAATFGAEGLIELFGVGCKVSIELLGVELLSLAPCSTRTLSNCSKDSDSTSPWDALYCCHSGFSSSSLMEVARLSLSAAYRPRATALPCATQ